jgi:sec-independent protein translocase protein TatA
MSWPGVPELLLIVIVILLLFGGSKLKDVMRSFGEGLREFRKATEEPVQQVQKDLQTPTTTLDAESEQNVQASEEQKPQNPPD